MSGYKQVIIVLLKIASEFMSEMYLENSRKIFMLFILTTQLQAMRNISPIDISQSKEIIALTTRFKIEQPGHTQSIFCHCFPHKCFTRHHNKG